MLPHVTSTVKQSHTLDATPRPTACNLAQLLDVSYRRTVPWSPAGPAARQRRIS